MKAGRAESCCHVTPSADAGGLSLLLAGGTLVPCVGMCGFGGWKIIVSLNVFPFTCTCASIFIK